MATAFPQARVPFCRTSAPPPNELAEITAFVVAILDAADRLLREVGFDTFAMEPLARRAGIAKGTRRSCCRYMPSS